MLVLEKMIQDKIAEISRKYENINKVILFGSRVRGDNREKSDIDLAVYGKGNICDFIYDLETGIDTLLEFDVTQVNRELDPLFMDQIQEEGITIYKK